MKPTYFIWAIILALNSTGCAFLQRKVEIYPIEKSDIFSVPKGSTCNGIVAEKDGWFLSDFYVQRVMDTSVAK